MKLGFTGTQKGMTSEQKLVVEKIMPKATEFHHGCCIGADFQAGQIANELQIDTIILHPPTNTSKMAKCEGNESREAKPYLDRNHDIVDETDILLATPKEFSEELRSGTWATIRYAKRNKKVVIVVWPDGKFDRFN